MIRPVVQPCHPRRAPSSATAVTSDPDAARPPLSDDLETRVEHVAARDSVSDLAQQPQLFDVAADADPEHGATAAQVVERRDVVGQHVRPPSRDRRDVGTEQDPLRHRRRAGEHHPRVIDIASVPVREDVVPGEQAVPTPNLRPPGDLLNHGRPPQLPEVDDIQPVLHNDLYGTPVTHAAPTLSLAGWPALSTTRRWRPRRNRSETSRALIAAPVTGTCVWRCRRRVLCGPIAPGPSFNGPLFPLKGLRRWSQLAGRYRSRGRRFGAVLAVDPVLGELDAESVNITSQLSFGWLNDREHQAGVTITPYGCVVDDRWHAPDLSGYVAVVTGASRGVGRGIAEVLAACGATVFAASRRGADVVGCIPVACDVGDGDAVDAFASRVEHEQGHLEILVNNAVGWGAYDTGSSSFLYEPPWHAPCDWWDANFTVGVRSHWLVTNALAPLMFRRQRGLVVFTSERQPDEPGLQELVMDLRATAVERMALLYSLHLRPHGVASIFLYPGFARTEAIQQAFDQRTAYFDGWSDDDFIERTASTHYTGRAAAVLAATDDMLKRTGTRVTAHDIAVEHGFTDVTGLVPEPI